MATGNGSTWAKTALITAILGWVAWASISIIVGYVERASAATERAYICKSIDEINHGIKNLNDYFMLPKPGKSGG